MNSKTPMPRVVIHFEQNGNYAVLIEKTADVRVFVVDERAPHDRVYEMTLRMPADVLDECLGDSPIGSRHDARHPGVEARVKAFLDGRPHHLAVVSETDKGSGEPQR